MSFLHWPWDSHCLSLPMVSYLQCCIVIRIGIVKCKIYCIYLYLNKKKYFILFSQVSADNGYPKGDLSILFFCQIYGESKLQFCTGPKLFALCV